MLTHRVDICTRMPTTIQQEASVCFDCILYDVVSRTFPLEQQITLYPHRDSNNDWQLFNASIDGSTFDHLNSPLEYIKPLMRIKLRHTVTEKHLHSHDHRPPVSEVDFQNEVSAYGMPGFAGDANDDWFVEIVKGDKRDSESTKRLRTLRSKFRLRHALTGCYLFSHKVKLPDWAYEQQEVTCNKNAVFDNSLWYIETSTHPLRAFLLFFLTVENAKDIQQQQLQELLKRLTTSSLASSPNSGSCRRSCGQPTLA